MAATTDGTQDASGANVGTVERWISTAAGGALAVLGLTRRTPAGIALAFAGATLAYRGLTGHCPVYGSMGVSTAGDEVTPHNPDATIMHGEGIKVEKSVTINKSPGELYRFWRNFENLPHFMKHLESVRVIDDQRSHWVAKAPMGRTVEWDAEIINEEKNEMIAWRSLEGADIPNTGSVHFKGLPAGRGTEVKVVLEYKPPVSKVSAAVAKLFGEEPAQQVEDDLRRFKNMMEAGEIPTNAGGPHG